MAKGKKSFIAYSDWRDTFDQLPDEEAGKLIKHVFAYVNDENPVTDSVLINAVFAQIKNTLNRDLEKWDRQLEQRREAGRISAERRAAKINDRSTTVETRQRNSTDSVSVSDSVNDSVSIKDNTRGVSKKETPKRKVFKPPSLEEVKSYCKERGDKVNAQQWLDHYTSNGWMVGKNKMKDWKAAVRTWERNNINNNTNGGFKQNTSRGATRTHMQRQDYD